MIQTHSGLSARRGVAIVLVVLASCATSATAQFGDIMGAVGPIYQPGAGPTAGTSVRTTAEVDDFSFGATVAF